MSANRVLLCCAACLAFCGCAVKVYRAQEATLEQLRQPPGYGQQFCPFNERTKDEENDVSVVGCCEYMELQRQGRGESASADGR